MSPPHPWLSVLVPFYRVEPYLRECVESVLAQVDGGVEIVLLDDASPDNCGGIARELRKQHGEVIRLLGHDRNRGLSAARNTLLADARGEYVWFLDSDDLLLPGAIAAVRERVQAQAPDLVLCDFRMVREKFSLKHRLRGELHRRTFQGRAGGLQTDRQALLSGLLAARELHAWSKIARAGVWRQAHFPEGRAFEDIAVIPALVAATHSYAYLDRPLVGYRQRGDSILATLTPAKLHDLMASLRELHAGLAPIAGPPGSEARFALDYFCLRRLASAAQKMIGREPALAEDLRATLAALFPQGTWQVLAHCRRRGWRVRGWRVRRGLRRLEALA